MGCCFSTKTADRDNQENRGPKRTLNERQDEEIALKDLNNRLEALYDGKRPIRTSDATRLSDVAALEIRLEKLQRPLNGSISEESEDDESPGRRSSEIDAELEERLRALGSGSTPQPLDITKLVVPPIEKVKKKKMLEEKHIEELSRRLDNLKNPLSDGRSH